MKKAVITGITGQDGSYLAEFLLSKDYEVWGVMRRSSQPERQLQRLTNVIDNQRLHLIEGDVTDFSSMFKIIKDIQPDEVYNLAAQSHVKVSFDQPAFTTNADAMGVLNILEAIRLESPQTKIYQAGSSEMFGNELDEDGYRRETTPMIPVSPYGCAKVYAHHMMRVYRSSYNIFACNGILFNHESPRRGLQFVTNKIVQGAIDIKKGLADKLALGNLDAERDWGHAKDYVKAMWLIMQQDTPDDYVCSMGETHSVREFCEIVFSKLDLNYEDYVVVDPQYFRPTELHSLVGDCSKLKKITGWEPSYTFESMVNEMIEDKL